MEGNEQRIYVFLRARMNNKENTKELTDIPTNTQ